MSDEVYEAGVVTVDASRIDDAVSYYGAVAAEV